MSKPHEVFETEDLLQKTQKAEISPASPYRNIRRTCCKKIPYRVWIGIMVFLTTYINYTTRTNMSVGIVSMVGGGKQKVKPYCLEDVDTTFQPLNGSVVSTAQTDIKLPDYGPRYDWGEKLQGVILGSYFYGYVVTSLFGGAASELIGPFHVIFWSHIIIAIMNSAGVWAAHLHVGAFIFCRVVIGALAGLVYPALQVLIAKWAPPNEKGKFVSMLMGNTIGTAVTWPLVGIVTMAWGWDWGFHVVTIQNFVFCLIFFFVASDSPDKSKCVGEEELNYIKECQGGSVSKKKTVAPYLKIFTSLPFWMLAILHFGNLWGLYVQLTTVPKFMAQVVGFDLKASGGLAALPHLARMFSGTMFGTLEDYLKSRKITTTKFNRKFFCLFSHILPGICLALIALTKCSAVGSLVLLVLSMSLNGAATITNLRNPQDLAPNFAGTIFGIISFIGGLTGFIVPAILGALISDSNTTHEWGIHFILGGTVYITGGVVFILFGSVELQPWNEIKDKDEA